MTNERTEKLPFFEHFGIDAQLAGKVLSRALSKGGDYADLFFEHRISGSIVLDDQRVETASRSVHLGVGIRVLDGDATGYAYTEDLTPEGMLRAATTAASVATGGGSERSFAVQGLSARDLYPVERPSLMVDAVDKLGLLRRADEAARAADERIKRVTVSFAESLKEILIVRSDGRFVSDVQPMIRFNVAVVAEDGGSRQSAVTGGGGRFSMSYFDDHPPEEHAREAARIVGTMLHAEDAPAGQLPVVLGPGDSGILLHEAVGHGLEADFNRKKTSNYSDSVGAPVAAPGCTVVDDGTLAHSRGSVNIDDEGHEPRRNVLIEDGVLRGYMHDRISARHFGLDPSGNARRQDYRHVPMPRMTNTYLLPGEHDPDEIIASVDRGIFAKSFSGGQVNISNGDFVFSVTEGYLIEDGKITAPIKDVNLIGNGPDALRKVSMVGTDFQTSDGRWTCGKDGQRVPVGVGIPTVKIDSLTVGGSRT